MEASLIPAPTTRSLARELGTIRRQLDAINAGGRATQLDRSSLMYPLLLRDPNTGEILGSFGPQNGSASLIPIGGAPPPAPSAPILTPLIEGVLVEWDGTFVDPEYVPPALLARGIMPRGLGAVTVTVPGYPAGKVAAAEAILSRLQAGQVIFEDWTWAGCPAVVGTWNDELLDDAEAAGLSGNDWPFSAAARDFLRAYLNAAEDAEEAAENPPQTGEGEGDPRFVEEGLLQLSPDSPGKTAAAIAILDRFRGGKPVNDNWTFAGGSTDVLTHGPILQREWRSRGRPEDFLQSYVATRDTNPHNFGYAGIHYGPTEDFVTDPSNMVGVLYGAGTFPISPVSEKIYVRLVGYNNSTPPVSGPASDTVGMTPNRVVATEILDGIVTELALSDQAVSTRTVQLASIQAQLVAAAAITGPAIAPSAVGTDKIAAQAVTADAMAANSVRAGSLEAASVTAAAIAAGAVGANAILANSIGAQQIAAQAIDATHLRAQSVTAGALAALSVTANAVAANAINAGHLTAGAVTADKLAALLVMTSRLIAGDPNGSRAEINAGGIYGFAGSLQSFALRSDGTAYLNGTIEAGRGSDRILIQPNTGSGLPEIQFFASPTGPAYINTLKKQQVDGAIGVAIGINSGPRSTAIGRQSTILVEPDRASMAYTQVGTAGRRGGEVYIDANFAQLVKYSDTGAQQSYFSVGANFINCNEVIDGPGFNVTSDRQAKTSIAADFGDWDPFVALKGQIGTWQYRTMDVGRWHLGPMDARVFPQWLQRTHPGEDNDWVTLGLGDLVGVALLMADRLDDRVSALEAAA